MDYEYEMAQKVLLFLAGWFGGYLVCRFIDSQIKAESRRLFREQLQNHQYHLQSGPREPEDACGMRRMPEGGGWRDDDGMV